MRLFSFPVIAVCSAVFGAAAAHAQTGPVIAIPGKAGVPVIINGVIVDGAVIYGDWGLGRGNSGQVVIEGLAEYVPNDDSRDYYPMTGRRPRVGRLEVLPKVQRVRQNTDFYREWSAGSDMRKPVTEYPPFNPPPVILAPRKERH